MTQVITKVAQSDIEELNRKMNKDSKFGIRITAWEDARLQHHLIKTDTFQGHTLTPGVRT